MHICHRSKSDDQDNTEELLNRLAPNHHWTFKKVHEEGDKLLLVHQTDDQRRLLAKYGDELCLLDATHKTSKYSIPLFFLVVRTNTVYQVVGSFLVSMETEECISAALDVLRQWNPNWKPSWFMTDHCIAEITALAKIFPGM
jgi:hypothetical protein